MPLVCDVFAHGSVGIDVSVSPLAATAVKAEATEGIKDLFGNKWMQKRKIFSWYMNDIFGVTATNKGNVELLQLNFRRIRP